MKYQLLAIILALYYLSMPVYASGSNEYISIISGKREYYHNRALEKELLSQAYNSNVQIIFNYIETKDTDNKTVSIIQDNVENSIPISVFSLKSNEQLQTINDTIKDQGILEHSFIDYTLVTAPFFSSLLFIDALPDETVETPVPWGFIGYDISAIVEMQLSYLRKTNTSNTILVLISNKDAIFEKTWLQTLENSISSDEKILIEYLENDTREEIMYLFDNKKYSDKNNWGILTLSDYVAILTGTIVKMKTNGNNNCKIIGFGGSPEAKLAITKNIIHMSIMPNYKEYGEKIIALAKILRTRKQELITNNYHLDMLQEASNISYVSVSTIP